MQVYARVVLVGFMGAGKSTVGALLASLLGWRFRDADAVITGNAGASIAELFSRYGEPWFRELEAAAAADLLTERETVVAFGGGALERADTRAKLAEDAATFVIYLETPLAVALERCREEPGAALRPVLAAEAALEQRYTRRLPFYRMAHLTVATSGRTPSEVARLIADAVQARKHPAAVETA